jgi:hypothetical protein
MVDNRCIGLSTSDGQTPAAVGMLQFRPGVCHSMQFRRTFALGAVSAMLVAAALPLSAQWPATEKLDLDAI